MWLCNRKECIAYRKAYQERQSEIIALKESARAEYQTLATWRALGRALVGGDIGDDSDAGLQTILLARDESQATEIAALKRDLETARRALAEKTRIVDNASKQRIRQWWTMARSKGDGNE
jgi:hypothetical protein